MEKNPNYKNFYEVMSMKEGDILIVDPYVIHLQDLTMARIGFKVPIIRVRRPFWGQGNLSEFINKVSIEDVRNALKVLEEEDSDDSRTSISPNP